MICARFVLLSFQKRRFVMSQSRKDKPNRTKQTNQENNVENNVRKKPNQTKPAKHDNKTKKTKHTKGTEHVPTHTFKPKAANEAIIASTLYTKHNKGPEAE